MGIVAHIDAGYARADRSLAEMRAEDHGTSYVLIDGDLYRIDEGRSQLVYVDHLYDKDSFAKNYAVKDGPPASWAGSDHLLGSPLAACGQSAAPGRLLAAVSIREFAAPVCSSSRRRPWTTEVRGPVQGGAHQSHRSNVRTAIHPRELVRTDRFLVIANNYRYLTRTLTRCSTADYGDRRLRHLQSHQLVESETG